MKSQNNLKVVKMERVYSLSVSLETRNLIQEYSRMTGEKIYSIAGKAIREYILSHKEKMAAEAASASCMEKRG